MTIEFALPEIGEGVESADIAEILVSEGDTVSPEQVVMELETEKAVVELPCPHAGVVKKIHVSEGDSISVGSVVMTIDDSGEGGESAAEEAAPKKKADKEDGKEQAEAKEETSKQATDETEEAAEDDEGEAEAGGETLEFKLPDIGEGVESADIAEILVSVGDKVEAQSVLMELETEKAVVELPAPEAGEITDILVSAGDSVTVGQHIITMKTGGKKKAPAKPQKKHKADAEPAKAKKDAKPEKAKAEKESEQAKKKKDEERRKQHSPTKETAPPTPKAVDPESSGTLVAASAKEGRPDGAPPVPAAPSTRRLARELGVDLPQVEGSGPGGRVTQEDVQTYVRERLKGGKARGGALAGPVPVAGSLAPPPLPDFSAYGVVEREKLNKIARTAAENLSTSWNVIPHVTQHDEADITELEAARKRFGAGIGKNGPKVTMTAIVMKALATALQAFPKFNSSLDPETSELVLKKYYNIGCAVDTENGLVVPVVRDCDSKSILEVAAELTRLAEQARDRKLAISDMQGATCTVTNLGGIGGVAFTPIINYPEVCILGMCRSKPVLQMVDGQVQERLIMPLSLSYDHRVINGADAARFMVAITGMLSDPFQLLAST